MQKMKSAERNSRLAIESAPLSAWPR